MATHTPNHPDMARNETMSANARSKRSRREPDGLVSQQNTGNAGHGGFEASSPGSKTLHLALESMSCASCVSTIEGALNAVPGVVDARVNFASEEAVVEVEPGFSGVDQLIAAVSDAGYRAETVSDDAADGDADQRAHKRLYRTLVKGSLTGIVTAIELSKATIRNVRQNLVGAFGYNLLGIPIAAGVLYPFTGLLVSPLPAGAAMSFSSVTVVTNANRLRRWTPSTPSVSPPTCRKATPYPSNSPRRHPVTTNSHARWACSEGE